jgi:hypothetical protein
LEQDEQWVYVAITDELTCQHCLQHEGKVFRRNQELDLLDIFPDLSYENDVTISPNVHMTLWNKPTCRCKLFLANLTELHINQPDTPVMDNEPKLDSEQPTVKPPEPAYPLENPFQIKPSQWRLSDNQFNNFLNGLASLGYITTTIYGSIVNRREKQSVTKQEVLAYLQTVSVNNPIWTQIQKVINNNSNQSFAQNAGE